MIVSSCHPMPGAQDTYSKLPEVIEAWKRSQGRSSADGVEEDAEAAELEGPTTPTPSAAAAVAAGAATGPSSAARLSSVDSPRGGAGSGKLTYGTQYGAHHHASLSRFLHFSPV